MRSDLRRNAVSAAILLILFPALVCLAGFRAGRPTVSPLQLAEPSGRTQAPGHRGDFTLPVWGVNFSDILDTFNQERPGGRRHEATDILAPRGTPIRAVTDGVIQKLFLSKPGGNTIYEFDSAAAYCYYYAHLDRYATGLHEGKKVKIGEVIGYVGTTGNADPKVPHLHFAIFKLGPEKQWWNGTPIDPYPILEQIARTPDSWSQKKSSYRRGSKNRRTYETGATRKAARCIIGQCGNSQAELRAKATDGGPAAYRALKTVRRR